MAVSSPLLLVLGYDTMMPNYSFTQEVHCINFFFPVASVERVHASFQNSAMKSFLGKFLSSSRKIVECGNASGWCRGKKK